MWIIADYEAASLFSLKPSSATSSGGKTLLVPTPFAIKIALLDAACRTLSVGIAEQEWHRLRDLRVAFQVPEKIVVTNLFQRMWKPFQYKGNAEGREHRLSEATASGDYPFRRDIGYREYAQWVGPLRVALGLNDKSEGAWLGDLLMNVNYFGKRGSFVQIVPPLEYANELPNGFVVATGVQDSFMLNGTLQMLDDCAPSLTFEKVNVYSDQGIRMGKERVTRHIVLPNYRLTRSSKSFSLYEHIEMEK